MSANLLAGMSVLSVLSRDDTLLNTSTFSKFSVSGPAAAVDHAMYNTSWTKLQEINQITNPHLIYPNQKIRLN
jgi:hypothetical protein